MAKSTSGVILHFVAVRLRAVGSGALNLYLRSYDNIRNTQLPNITLSATTNRMPTIISNFREQAAQLELGTTAINETFTIDKIIVYAKPTSTGYPQ